MEWWPGEDKAEREPLDGQDRIGQGKIGFHQQKERTEYLSQAHSLGDCVCLIQNHFVFMAVEHVLPKHSGEVIVHIGADVVELANEGVLYPISYRLAAEMVNAVDDGHRYEDKLSISDLKQFGSLLNQLSRSL